MKTRSDKQNGLKQWWNKNKPDTFLSELKQYRTAQRIAIIISSLFFAFYFFMSFGIYNGMTAFGQVIGSNIALFAMVSAAIVLGLSVIFIYIHLKLLKINFNGNLRKPTNIQTISIIVFSILSMLVVFLVNYPTIPSCDVTVQMTQAQTGVYSNWHPAMHTFLFYKIPIILFGVSYNAVTAFQCAVVALIIAYTGYSFCSFGIRPIVFYIMIALMIVNSRFLYIMNYSWKDIPYSFGMLLLTVCCMWIYFTDGDWLGEKRNIALLSISSFLVLFMRHNGILSFVAVFIALIIAYKPKRKTLLIVFASLLVSYFVITIPVYNLLGIEQHDESFAEKLGVPNNQIAYIVLNDGDVSEEELEFIDNYISIDTIKQNYKLGNFNNNVKWSENYNGKFLEENKAEYMGVWFSLVKKNFVMAVKAYGYTTCPLWRAELILKDVPSYSVGFAFFFATLSIMIASIKDKRRFIVFIPVLINMLGIMCLITGGEFRFVFANLTTSIPLVVFSFIQMENKSLDINNQIKSNI